MQFLEGTFVKSLYYTLSDFETREDELTNSLYYNADYSVREQNVDFSNPKCS